MRIVTRPDFDGIVCAVLLYETENITEPIFWIEPGDIQRGSADIKKGDILANLPCDKRGSLWFDHHVSNKLEKNPPGAFKVAPSAAGVIYEYYQSIGKLNNEFDELIKETDIIDSADLSRDMVLFPEKYPYLMLSMTVKNRDADDPGYWNRLVTLLRKKSIQEVLEDPEVEKRCKNLIEENKKFEKLLVSHTEMHKNISVTDFRDMEKAPSGNRFLVYSLFPDAMASMRIRYDHKNKNTVLLSIGRSIFNDNFKINIGQMLSKYGGGGHFGAGGCSMDAESAEKNIPEILETMKANR